MKVFNNSYIELLNNAFDVKWVDAGVRVNYYLCNYAGTAGVERHT